MGHLLRMMVGVVKVLVEGRYLMLWGRDLPVTGSISFLEASIYLIFDLFSSSYR